MIRFLGAALVLLAPVLAVDACPVRVRSYYPSFSYAAVSYPVVQTVAVAVPVYVPTYSATYGSSVELQKLLAEVQALRQEVQQLRTRPHLQQQQPQQYDQPPPREPPPMPRANGNGANGPGVHKAAVIIVRHCAACHEASVAPAKGKGFVLVQGDQPVQLSDRQALNVAREIYSGRMPKGSKVSDEDVGEIMSWLDTLK